jgi:hypothetical protein
LVKTRTTNQAEVNTIMFNSGIDCYVLYRPNIKKFSIKISGGRSVCHNHDTGNLGSAPAEAVSSRPPHVTFSMPRTAGAKRAEALKRADSYFYIAKLSNAARIAIIERGARLSAFAGARWVLDIVRFVVFADDQRHRRFSRSPPPRRAQ